MASEFDIRKYKHDGQVTSTNQAGISYDLIDGSDSLANQVGQVISFQNVRNDKDVFFKAFITAFNETYSPNFNPTEVFGRTDPIYQYKNTTRNITLAFKMPAASESEAFENLGRVQKLLQMLYPSYKDINNALTLSQAPLVRLKVMNLLTSHPGVNYDQGAEGWNKDTTIADKFVAYRSTEDPGHGLLGVITSCTINHNLEGTDGVFQRVDAVDFGTPLAVPNTILPKLIDVNLSFSPLHEFTLTFDKDGSDSNPYPVFPYGVKLEDNPKVKAKAVPRGKSLSELRELKKTLEEKRRAAAAAQQNVDRKTARFLRTAEKLNSSDNERQSRRLTRRAARQAGRLDEEDVNQAMKAGSAAADYAAAQTEIEGLIG